MSKPSPAIDDPARTDAVRTNSARANSSRDPAERTMDLWALAVSPAIWGGHLLLSYATVAIWCTKRGTPLSPLGPARTAVVVYTTVALAGILATGWFACWRRRAAGESPPPHDRDSPGDRTRFLAFATLLLSGLSAVAVVYAAVAVLLFRDCR